MKRPQQIHPQQILTCCHKYFVPRGVLSRVLELAGNTDLVRIRDTSGICRPVDRVFSNRFKSQLIK